MVSLSLDSLKFQFTQEEPKVNPLSTMKLQLFGDSHHIMMAGVGREGTLFAPSMSLNRSPHATIASSAIARSALIVIKFHGHFTHMQELTMLSRRSFVSLEVLEHYCEHSIEISSYLRQCNLILLLFILNLASKKL